jgi:nucleoside-diphosphate-sugar epimerase
MRCLITGAKGLLGHELCKQLTHLGHEVYALDNGWRGQHWPSQAHIIDFDLARDDMCRLPKDIDHIYHYAAMNGTSHFYRIPNQLLSNNLRSDLNLLEWATGLNKLQRLIYASSSEVVSGHQYECVPEISDIAVNDMYNPRWSYRLPKMCAENYLANSDLPYVIIRYFNVYGAHSLPGHFVHDIMNKLRQQDFQLVGADETRCYCHVTDAVAATIKLSDQMRKTFNVGSDQEITTQAAADTVAKAMGYDLVTWSKVPGLSGSAQRRRPDISRLRSVMPDFSPRSFEVGINEIIRDADCKRPSL